MSKKRGGHRKGRARSRRRNRAKKKVCRVCPGQKLMGKNRPGSTITDYLCERCGYTETIDWKKRAGDEQQGQEDG